MEINLLSLIAILIIIITLVIAYWRKMMMTYAIIIANFLVFLLTIFFPDQIIGTMDITQNPGLGFRPAYLSIDQLPHLYTLFTSMFVHSGFLHILGNMFVFFFMGVAFEQRIGRKKFLVIYLITGICGALTHSALNLGSWVPVVGASGAIFGILGAFAYAYPRDEVIMPVPLGIMLIMRIKVIYATILFAILETVVVIFSVQDSTAHFAHLGGLVSGVLLAALLIGKKAEKTKNANPAGSLDYMQIKKSDTINFSHLKALVKTPELTKILQRVEKENVLQVRDLWLEHFLEKVTCPVCNKPLNHFDRKIWCEQEHFQTDY